MAAHLGSGLSGLGRYVYYFSLRAVLETCGFQVLDECSVVVAALSCV
jgi:hypothetical protein